MLLGGQAVFPITLAGGPPLPGIDPATGLKGWTEITCAGVKMLRVYPKWDAFSVAEQIQTVKEQMIAASVRGGRSSPFGGFLKAARREGVRMLGLAGLAFGLLSLRLQSR